MKIGTMHCPYCSSNWVALYPEEMDILPCPFCDGLNEAPADALPITGRCCHCNQPLDDHGWDGAAFSVCPSRAEQDYAGPDWTQLA